MKEVTVVITPRDRYSGVDDCIETLYQYTPEPFDLFVLDLGYPERIRTKIERLLSGRPDAKIVPLGMMIPMEAFARIRDQIETPYVFLLDNDSRVTEGWLPPLLECAREENAALVNPVILERKGVGGGSMRNHLFTNEIRVVRHEGTPYLIEHKNFLRLPYEELPKERATTEMFELHGVLFETKAFQEVELPAMVIREHIDVGMQLRAMGRRLMSEPKSVILFDNLNQRMSLADMRFFNFRWSKELAERSSRLFEKRWGLKFYSEQFIMNWIRRRRLFLRLRWLGFPIAVADLVERAYRKFFLSEWDPLPDPIGASEHFYGTLSEGMPERADLVPSATS